MVQAKDWAQVHDHDPGAGQLLFQFRAKKSVENSGHSKKNKLQAKTKPKLFTRY